MRLASSPKIGAGIAIAAGLVWGFGAIHVRRAESDAFQYLIWRSIAIVVVIEVVALVRRRPSPLRAAVTGGPMMWAACASLLLASIGFVYAVDVNGAAQSAFLSSTTPLFAVVGGWIFLRERLSKVTVGAVLLGLLGLAIMVSGTFLGGSAVGNVSAVASSIGFAVYTVCVRSDRQRDWVPVLPGYCAAMIVLCAGVTAAKGNSLVPGAQPIGLAVIHGAVYIVVGTMLFNFAARSIPAVAMTVYAQAEMVGVPVLGFLILDERPATRTVAGAAVVLAAILINALWGGDDQAAPTADDALDTNESAQPSTSHVT